MHNLFAPLIATAQRGIPFTASDGQAFVRLNAPSPAVSTSSPSAPVLTASGSSMNSSPNTARSLPPAPSTPSSIARKPQPTTTTPTSAPPSGVASDAVVAATCQLRPMPTLADSAIQLKFRHLHKPIRIIALRTIRETHPAKKPPDASPILTPPPQPIEK